MSAQDKISQNNSTQRQPTGYQQNEMPHGNHNKRSKKWKSKRTPNSQETKSVPSKRWSKGETRKETHHHGKLLRGTQLHGNTRTRKRPHYGQSTPARRKRNSHDQRNDRFRSNRRLYRPRSLQQTRDQVDQNKKPKRDLPCGREAKRYGTSHPYDESTYGH